MPIKLNTIHSIKQELIHLPKELIIEHCLKLAKYKKENKELLNYLLFEAQNEESYIDCVKKYMDIEFSNINKDSLYYTKKNIRRILRTTTKHIKYSGKKETQIELLIYFCLKMQNCGLYFNDSKTMVNLFQRQVKNIEKAIDSLHEDFRLDFENDIDKIKMGL